MKEISENILVCLKKGETFKSLELLFDLASKRSRPHLHEVTSQIARYKLISENDRSGSLSFDDRLRLEAQVSSSVLKMLTAIESVGEKIVPESQVNKVKANLESERSKRIDLEYRLNKLEKGLDESRDETNVQDIFVRQNITGEKVELRVMSLNRSVTQADNYALILGEIDGPYRYPIIIGGIEARAIAMKMEKMVPIRPMTHDLLTSMINTHRSTLESVIIDDLVDGIHYAKLVLLNSGRILEIDSRTSDAVCTAVAQNVPIYTYRHILEMAGIVLDEGNEIESQEPKP